MFAAQRMDFDVLIKSTPIAYIETWKCVISTKKEINVFKRKFSGGVFGIICKFGKLITNVVEKLG